jgi:hypothetical protein
MLKERVFNIVWVAKENPVPFDPEIIPNASVMYDGQMVRVGKKK